MKIARAQKAWTFLFSFGAIAALAACGGPNAPANDSGNTANGVHDDKKMLASLDAKTAQVESWTSDDATSQSLSVLYFSPQNFQLSAQCKQPGAALSCDALRYLQNGMPAEIPKREIDSGHGNVGRAICIHLGNQPFSAKNPVGSVQSFCRFPDGSFSTLAALEQHSLRIIQ